MKKHYKIKETNKTKLKSYLKGKSNNNTNERNTRHSTGSNR
jgi:hypothetical protein